MPQANIKKRKPVKLLHLSILAVTFIICYSYTFDTKIAMLGDNASYYMLGKALSEGAGYINISSPSQTPNNHYPPGYPAIIGFIMTFTSSILVLKILNGFLFLAGLYVLYALLLRILNNGVFSFVITFFILINSHLLWYSSIMMSEIPFLFFSSLSFLCFIKIDPDKFSWKNPFLIICLLSLVFSYYIRSLGVALLGGYLLYFLMHKRWKEIFIFFLTFVAGALPWFIRGQQLGGGSYLKQLTMINPYRPALGQADVGDFLQRIFNNFSRYITREIPSAIFPIKSPEYNTPLSGGEWIFGLIIGGLIIYGIYSLPKFKWLIGGYLLATLCILMIWPEVWIGVRFIVPVIPFFLLSFFNGLYQILKGIRKLMNIQKPVQAYWLLLFVLLFLQPLNHIHKRAKIPYSGGWQNYFKIAKWLNKHEDSSVLVSCGKPSLFYLYSDTYTTRYKFAQNPAEVIADLDKRQVDYVVIDQVYGNTLRYLLPAVRQYPERFDQVYHLRNPDTFLLKFKPK